LEENVKLFHWTVILLFSSYAVGQVSPTNNTMPVQPKAETGTGPAQVARQKTHGAQVPAQAPVITVPGVCNSSATPASDCKTVFTRAQFEELVSALPASRAGGIPAEMRGILALQYGQMMVLAQEAEKQGLDKDSDVQSLLRFGRTQVLAQRWLRSMQEKARPSAQEIQQYYEENTDKYQGISVQRVLIPFGHAADKSEAEKKKLKTLAGETRQRLVAGADPAKVEHEIYQKLGFKKPPETALVLRLSTLPLDRQSLAKLKAGEVSEVFSDTVGWLIFKSGGEKPLPLGEVRGEIESTLQQQKIKAATEALLSDRKPVLNETYFGPVTKTRSPHE
jgi:peptidyl-prolyl cis-trans isomerase C